MDEVKFKQIITAHTHIYTHTNTYNVMNDASGTIYDSRGVCRIMK